MLCMDAIHYSVLGAGSFDHGRNAADSAFYLQAVVVVVEAVAVAVEVMTMMTKRAKMLRTVNVIVVATV